MDEKKKPDGAADLLEALEESAPTEEMLRLKGIPIVVPSSSRLKPRSGYGAYTKRWQPAGDFRKRKQKMQKASKKKNRKRRKK